VRHTRIALMSAEGISNQFIAERCGVNVPTIKRLAAQLRQEVKFTSQRGWSGFAGI
jgi:DNA-binding CsgD family transcriptional regulator